MTRRSASALVTLAALGTLGTTASTAHADPLPPAHAGLAMLISHGGGTSANDLGTGVGAAIQAGWQPMTTEQRLGWVVRWGWSRNLYGDAPAAPVTRDLELTELEMTVGARLAPTAAAGRYLTARVGAALLRSNESIPPDDTRSYVGPLGYVGYEQAFVGPIDVSIELRYSLITAGPSQVSACIGLGWSGL